MKIQRLCKKCKQPMAYIIERGRSYWLCINPDCENYAKEINDD